MTSAAVARSLAETHRVRPSVRPFLYITFEYSEYYTYLDEFISFFSTLARISRTAIEC